MALRPSYQGPGNGNDIVSTSGAVVFMLFVAAGSAYIIAAKLGSVNRTLSPWCRSRSCSVTPS